MDTQKNALLAFMITVSCTSKAMARYVENTINALQQAITKHNFERGISTLHNFNRFTNYSPDPHVASKSKEFKQALKENPQHFCKTITTNNNLICYASAANDLQIFEFILNEYASSSTNILKSIVNEMMSVLQRTPEDVKTDALQKAFLS